MKSSTLVYVGITLLIALIFAFTPREPQAAAIFPTPIAEAESIPAVEASLPLPDPQSTVDILAAQRAIEDTLHPEVRHPTRISIPSIKLRAPIVNMGINTLGEMDVPAGNTGNVGWYKAGTVPGDTGSAVMDAHVYAAFKKLKHVRVGDHIYVKNARGETLDFIVRESKLYTLEGVPNDFVFTAADARRLTLITCEGRYIRSRGTYDHRRIVFATLAD